jgi:hypothetical protein
VREGVAGEETSAIWRAKGPQEHKPAGESGTHGW